MSPIDHCLFASYSTELRALWLPDTYKDKMTDYYLPKDGSSFFKHNIKVHPELSCLNAAQSAEIEEKIKHFIDQYATNSSYASEECKLQQTIQKKITQICYRLKNHAQEQYKQCYTTFQYLKHKIETQYKICNELRSMFNRTLSSLNRTLSSVRFTCSRFDKHQVAYQHIFQVDQTYPPIISSKRYTSFCSQSIEHNTFESKCVNKMDKTDLCNQIVEAWNANCPQRDWSVFSQCEKALQTLNDELSAYEDHNQSGIKQLNELYLNQTTTLNKNLSSCKFTLKEKMNKINQCQKEETHEDEDESDEDLVGLDSLLEFMGSRD